MKKFENLLERTKFAGRIGSVPKLLLIEMTIFY